MTCRPTRDSELLSLYASKICSSIKGEFCKLCSSKEREFYKMCSSKEGESYKTHKCSGYKSSHGYCALECACKPSRMVGLFRPKLGTINKRPVGGGRDTPNEMGGNKITNSANR